MILESKVKNKIIQRAQIMEGKKETNRMVVGHTATATKHKKKR